MERDFVEKLNKISEVVAKREAEYKAAQEARSPIKKLWDGIGYFYYDSIRNIQHIFARKYKLEKEHREWGYTYWDRPWKSRESWNASYHLAWITLPVLLRFKRSKRWGIPGLYDSEYSESNKEAWEEILNKMIFAFELLVREDISSYEEADAITEGLNLYAKHFRDLWD